MHKLPYASLFQLLFSFYVCSLQSSLTCHTSALEIQVQPRIFYLRNFLQNQCGENGLHLLSSTVKVTSSFQYQYSFYSIVYFLLDYFSFYIYSLSVPHPKLTRTVLPSFMENIYSENIYRKYLYRLIKKKYFFLIKRIFTHSTLKEIATQPHVM